MFRRFVVYTILLSVSLLAINAVFSLSNTKGILINTNWEKFKVTISGEMPLGKSVSVNERQFLRLQAKETLLRETSFYLENFLMDASFSLKELLSINQNFAQEYSIFLQDLELGSLYFHKGRVSTTLTIPLRGSLGLINYLPIPWEKLSYYSLKEKEYIGEAYHNRFAEGEYFKRLAPVTYTGLIIDASEFKIRATLAPRIYSKYGRLIYGPEYISRKVGIQRGVASYVKSLNENEVYLRAGKNPFLIVPLAIKGNHQSDFVIADEDAKKILESKNTVMNLEKCRVIILYKDL